MDQHDKAVEAAEAQGFEQVDGEGHVFARSSGEVDGQGVKDAPDSDPQKDESSATPQQSPLQTAPQRHEHTAHDVDGRDLTIEDADFDADHGNEVKANGNED